MLCNLVHKQITFRSLCAGENLNNACVGVDMDRMSQWSLVGVSGALCASLAWSAAPVATLEALHASAAEVPRAPVASTPDERSINSHTRSTSAAPHRAAAARPTDMRATAPASVEETRASLGQMLASWGLVACIALRRIFD